MYYGNNKSNLNDETYFKFEILLGSLIIKKYFNTLKIITIKYIQYLIYFVFL